jgi:hypothetical protein
MRILRLHQILAVALFGLIPGAALHGQQSTSASVLRGDVNGDGRVTAADAQAVRDHVAGRPVPRGWVMLPNGDANGDGRITGVDAAIIQAFAAGRDLSRFGLGQPARGGERSGALVVQYECTVHVESGTLNCGTPRSAGAAADVILAKPHIGFVTTGAATSRANPANEDTTSANVAIINNLDQPIGTTDGTSAAASGSRVFFEGPRVTAVTSGTMASASVRLEGTDGTADFQSPDGTLVRTGKAYVQYDGVLAKGDTAAAKLWQFIYSANVATFTYSVLVSAPVQYEYGWVTITPAAGGVEVGSTTPAPTVTVHDPVGRTIADSVVWSSSDTTLARVNPATGQVTGVAQGTSTITATSATDARRKGTYQVVVSTPASGGANTFPAIPPEHFPDSLVADRNIDSNAPWGPSIRDVVTVQFTLGSTPAQRKAAVDSVQGVVIGGMRVLGPEFGDDGVYLIKVPADSTRATWKRAYEYLDALPQVEFAQPELVFGPDQDTHVVKPNDGGGWERNTWAADPDSASQMSQARWGLEAIAAPSAWACNVGDDEGDKPNVAIEDIGFPLQDDDLLPNITHYDLGGTFGNHGGAVTSVLGAVGNNGRLMTGVMQRANIATYDRYSAASFFDAFKANAPLTFRYRAYIRAVKSGAPVINMSFGINWLKIPLGGTPHLPDPTNSYDSLYARTYATPYRVYTNLLEQKGFRPLLVISAGNEKIDAWWAGTPQLALHYPTRVLVVGAATRYSPGGGPNFNGYGRWADPFLPSGSNGGSLVDIMAPGNNVGAIYHTATGYAVKQVTGTSFSAPMVSGVAGLLVSANPKLTSDELRQIILEGARTGGRVVPPGESPRTVYLLNAHAALKYSGERYGGTMCANPVWQDPVNGDVFARRGTGTNFRDGTTDLLFRAPLGGVLAPLQGNRVLRAGTTGYRFGVAGWAALDSFPPASGENESNLSREGKAFGGDSVVTVLKEVQTSGGRRTETFIVQLNGREVWRVTPPSVRWETPITTCVKWLTGTDPNNQCDQFASTWNARVATSQWHALSPGANRIALTIARDSSATVVDSTGSYGGFQFRYHHLTEETQGTTVYVLERPTGTSGTWNKIHEWTWNFERLERPAFSADAINFAVDTRMLSHHVNFTPDGSQFGAITHVCGAMYANVSRSFRFFPKTYNRPSFSDMSPCYPNLTFAP